MVARSRRERIIKIDRPRPLYRRYVLTEEGVEVGSLHFVKTFGSLAVAECGGRRYTMKRSGFLRPTVTVRKAELEEDLAVLRLERGWGIKCTLEMANGRTLSMRGPTLRDRTWAFHAPEGEVVVFRPHALTFSFSGTCSVDYDRWDIDPLLLALIGWYFIILTMEEQAAAAAAAASC